MRLDALFTAAWLAATATAIGPASPDKPPRLQGKPEKMASWRWPNPFASPRYAKYTPACEAERTFTAREHLLDDLSEPGPNGLLAYRDALRSVFSAREYPGSWDGIDPHGYDRKLLIMDYDAMPLKVREWIEEQERSDGPGRGLFAIYGRPAPGTRVMNTIKVPEEVPVSEEWRGKDDRRVVLFAPGAIYEMLPLWVAEGSDCEESLLDLSKYSAKLADGRVVAYPVQHTSPKLNDREIEFQIKAQVLKLKEGEVEEDVLEIAQGPEAAEKGEETEAAKSEKAGETKSVEEAKRAGKDEL
ncbi:hypothetical protein N657DRAFT_650338 [Parathielavia appendiculata]|uniref:Uncharacterized protein n=1 Tax=Parathielavia appendiculata TaxID=2587402 RepID=A0AAN6TRD9_9PEZI|nr:hypothetical protein N657DRAFT_650338 [Parathielavia appendiculata]